MRGQRKNPRKAVQPFENKKRKIDIFKNYEANGVEKIQRKLEIFSTLISKKSSKKPFTTPLCPGFISRSCMMFSYWKMRTTFISAATPRFTAILASPTARRRGPFCAEVITEATLPTYKPKSRRRFNSLGGIFPSFAILHCTFIGSWIRR